MDITFDDVRKDLPSDQLHYLFKSAGWSDDTETGEQKKHFNMPFINSTLVLSAWDNTRLVGAVRVLSDTIIRSVIYDLVVDPEYQDRDIGRQMLRRCLKHFPGSEWVVSTTARVAEFYEKQGFIRDERLFLSIPSMYFAPGTGE